MPGAVSPFFLDAAAAAAAAIAAAVGGNVGVLWPGVVAPSPLQSASAAAACAAALLEMGGLFSPSPGMIRLEEGKGGLDCCDCLLWGSCSWEGGEGARAMCATIIRGSGGGGGGGGEGEALASGAHDAVTTAASAVSVVAPALLPCLGGVSKACCCLVSEQPPSGSCAALCLLWLALCCRPGPVL
jgi:hypothetical protein